MVFSCRRYHQPLFVSHVKVSQRINTAWARALKSEPPGSPAQLLPEQPRLAGRTATEGFSAPAPDLALDLATLLLFPDPLIHAFPWQKVFQGQAGGLDLPPRHKCSSRSAQVCVMRKCARVRVLPGHARELYLIASETFQSFSGICEG